MLTVTSLDETKALIKREYSNYHVETETVSIETCVNRVLASDITSCEDSPHFKRSTLDGYAVKANDTFGASEAIPAILKLFGEVKMNSEMNLTLKGGGAIYVPTGGYLPEGADAVAMIEITEQLEDDILITKSVAPGTGIIFKGDDTKTGDVVLRANQRITPKSVGALAALGVTAVPVKRKLICGILSTGDELISIDTPLQENRSSVRDVNSHFLKAQAEQFGCEVVSYGICSDHKETLVQTVRRAYEQSDIVLVSGGSSVGIMDLTKDVFKEAAGAELLIHGIAVKPGKPTILAKSGKKALIGLPGHPVSAFFIMQEVVKHVINTLYGVTEEMEPFLVAKITENIVSNHGRDEFIPVKIKVLEGIVLAHPVSYKSGLITLLSKSDGYLKISRFAEGLNKGTLTNIYRF